MWKPSSKFLSIVIVIAELGAVSVAASTTPPVTNTPVSSAIVSSEKEVSNVDDGVTEIQKATDEGVSRIKEETSKAIQTIQNNTPSSPSSNNSSSNAPTDSKPTTDSTPINPLKSYNITTSGNINITKQFKGKSQTDCLTMPNRKNAGSVSDGFVVLTYQLSGNMDSSNENNFCTVDGLKSEGFTVLDVNSKTVNFEGCNGTQIKVPFTSISDVSTLYLVYQGQKITINIS